VVIPLLPVLVKRAWKVLIRKDRRRQILKKRLHVVENIVGLFAERMQVMTASVAGAGQSWLEGRAGEKREFETEIR
jgi:hypothetical protein